MIAAAKVNAGLAACEPSPTFEVGDCASFTTAVPPDAIVSLFHAIGYQRSNEQLMSTFHAARSALKLGGLFIFDFWYGPGVLTDRPAVRLKRINVGELNVIRFAEPTLLFEQNTVEIAYTLFVRDMTNGKFDEIQEKHLVRFLFLPEIEMIASSAGFKLHETGEWMTEAPLSENSWYGYAVVQAI
jgi:hypothetical protein